MKLHSVTMKNFMPYKGVHKVDFPTDQLRNIMIIFGENMKGKTSFFNAIRWGFYGKAIGRHSRPIPMQELPNKEAILEDDWTVEVHIQFEANGSKYDLRRRAEKKNLLLAPSKPEDFIIQVFLKKDEIPVQGGEVENEINSILPEQISRFFLFDGELLDQYESLLVENSDQGRQIKEAIEQVLGVPALINGRDELATLSKAAQKAQQKDLERLAGLDKLAQTQGDLTTKQESYEKDLISLQEKLKATQDERTVLDDEIERYQSVHTSKVKLDSLVERQKQIEEYRSSKKIERLDILSQAWRDLVEIKLTVRRTQLEEERTQLMTDMRQQSGLETKIEQLQKLLNTKNCPTCKQDISDDRRANIGADLGSLQSELDKFKDQSGKIQTLSAQIEGLSKVRGVQARDRMAQINKDLQHHEVELTKIENEIQTLNDVIKGFDTAEIARKRVLRDKKVEEEGRLQGDINIRKKDIDKVKNEIAVLQMTIDGFASARNTKSRVKASLCSQLEKVFSQSIEKLRDRLRKTVEGRANEAFKAMTTQKSYRGLEINDNYGLSIIDDRGQRVTIRSAGAEQVVALSLIDGLNRTGRNTASPVVMDTPFGRLDPNHRDNILSYLPNVTSQFVLLVHSGEIRPETDLDAIKARIGAVFKIREITSRHSVIEKATL